MKIVPDTNVLISALIKKGKPRSLLLEILRGKHQFILSREILEEFAQATAEPKIRRYVDEEDVIRFLVDIGRVTRIVKIRSEFSVILEDPDDDIILRTGYDGKASYIVSGDNHLLTLRKYRRIKIVTVDEMLKILKARQ
jgi:putative PIN family toxin of toxin-antitoxin system